MGVTGWGTGVSFLRRKRKVLKDAWSSCFCFRFCGARSASMYASKTSKIYFKWILHQTKWLKCQIMTLLYIHEPKAQASDSCLVSHNFFCSWLCLMLMRADIFTVVITGAQKHHWPAVQTLCLHEIANQKCWLKLVSVGESPEPSLW